MNIYTHPLTTLNSLTTCFFPVFLYVCVRPRDPQKIDFMVYQHCQRFKIKKLQNI